MGNLYPRIQAKKEKQLPKPVLQESTPISLLGKADGHLSCFLLQTVPEHYFCWVKTNTPSCGCPKGSWYSPAWSTLHLPSLSHWQFLEAPRKGEAFNDRHWTRLEISLLKDLSRSMWNNSTGGDVTFLVGEHIKGACLCRSPWTPKGVSGCQVSLDWMGRGSQRRLHKPAH